MDLNTKFILALIGKINFKVNRHLVAELKKYNLLGIAPSHGDILRAFFTSNEFQMKDIADVINKDKSTVTALVNKLIRFGYVEKITSPDDSRIRLVRLTKKGETMKPIVLAIGEKMREKAYKGLSKAEQKTLLTLLEKIFDNM